MKSFNSDEQGARVSPGDAAPPTVSQFDLFRRRFLAGLMTIVPAFIAIWAIILIVGFVEDQFRPFVEPPLRAFVSAIGYGEQLVSPLTTLFSIGVAILFVTSVGWLTRFLAFRRLIRMGERTVARIPLIRFFYQTPKEVIKVLTSKRDSIKRVVLIEYPTAGTWALAFATGEIEWPTNSDVLVTVFMPSTPNPTTGFLMMVPRNRVLDINLSVEDAVRLIMSGGILSPNSLHTAPFAGMLGKPDLPPPEPLTADIPPELRQLRETEDEE